MFAEMHNTSPTSRSNYRVQAREPAANTLTSAKTRYSLIGIILALALFSFEIFNFDTTQYALTDLMGEVRFANIKWATILAIAFCGIDFAGLLRVFTPDDGDDTPSEVWYLMAAWLLGATMNAVMTWYAVSLTLANHHIGNEILNEAQLLRIVPIFVAFLVWLTRILFIGALTVAGNRILDRAIVSHPVERQHPARAARPATAARQQARVRPNPNPSPYRAPIVSREIPLVDVELEDDVEIEFIPQSEKVTQSMRRR